MKKRKEKASAKLPQPSPAPSPIPLPNPSHTIPPAPRKKQPTYKREIFILFFFSFFRRDTLANHHVEISFSLPSSLSLSHHALGIAKRDQGEGAPSLPFSLFSRLSTPTLPSPRQPPTSHLPFNPLCLPFTCSGWVAVAWGWPRGSRRGRQGGGAARRRCALGGGGPLGCRGSGG